MSGDSCLYTVQGRRGGHHHCDETGHEDARLESTEGETQVTLSDTRSRGQGVLCRNSAVRATRTSEFVWMVTLEIQDELVRLDGDQGIP